LPGDLGIQKISSELIVNLSAFSTFKGLGLPPQAIVIFSAVTLSTSFPLPSRRTIVCASSNSAIALYHLIFALESSSSYPLFKDMMCLATPFYIPSHECLALVLTSQPQAF